MVNRINRTLLAKCIAKTIVGKACKRKVPIKGNPCWIHAVRAASPHADVSEGVEGDAQLEDDVQTDTTEKLDETETTEKFEGPDGAEEHETEESDGSEEEDYETDTTEELDAPEDDDETDTREELNAPEEDDDGTGTTEESDGSEEDYETEEDGSEDTYETDGAEDDHETDESDGSEGSEESEEDDLMAATEPETYHTEVAPVTERSAISPEFYLTVMALLRDIHTEPSTFLACSSTAMADSTHSTLRLAGKLENYGFTYVGDATRPFLCDGFYYTHAEATGFTLFEIDAGQSSLRVNLEVLYATSGTFRVSHFFRPDTLYVLLQANGPAVIAFGHALTTVEERKTYDTFHARLPCYVRRSGNFQFQPVEGILFDRTRITAEMCDQFLSDIDYSMNVVAYE